MPGALDVVQLQKDVFKFLTAETHLGGTNPDFQTHQNIYKRKRDAAAS